MNALAERAKAYATRSSERIEANIAREWWAVRKPGEDEPTPVFFWPTRTRAEVQAWYPQCGVLPL